MTVLFKFLNSNRQKRSFLDRFPDRYRKWTKIGKNSKDFYRKIGGNREISRREISRNFQNPEIQRDTVKTGNFRIFLEISGKNRKFPEIRQIKPVRVSEFRKFRAIFREAKNRIRKPHFRKSGNFPNFPNFSGEPPSPAEGRSLVVKNN